MGGLRESGSEQLTIIERIVGILPLPYAVSCIIWSAILGAPTEFLVYYLDTQNPRDALERIARNFGLTGSGGAPTIQALEGLGVFILVVALGFYVLYFVRFMRTRIAATKFKLSALSPGGEDAFHRAFGRVSHSRGAIVLTALLFVTSIPSRAATYSGYSSLIYSAIAFPLTSFAFGTFFWVYFSSLWGLHKFGKEALRLKPYHEDNMLGLRPVGSVSLSLALTFFGFAGLSTLGFFITPFDLGTLAVLTLMIIFGTAMFFLPLHSTHMKMRDEKRRKQVEIRNQVLDIRNVASKSTLEDSQRAIVDLLTLQMLRDEVSRIPTWPLDTGIIGRLTAIILSVIAITIARIIQMALGL